MKPLVCLLLLFGLGLANHLFAFAQEPLLDKQMVDEPFFIGLESDKPILQSVQVKSDHVYDYTFSKAPTDWRVQSGKWAMTNRWSCSPGWSWFGGRSEEVAAIWNKRKFSGDFSLHVYFAFKEGSVPETARWREKQSDVGISFSGDGTNLGSGYALILGANDNGHTVLLKQGEVVRESLATEARFPSMVDGVPPAWERYSMPRSATNTTTSNTTNTRSFRGSDASGRAYGQTHWWHAVIDKFDNRIECWLDGKLLFSYDDPQPLHEGQIALWTYNNGVVLSRVQIYYENEVKRSFVKKSQAGEPKRPQTVSEVVKSEVKEQIAAPE
jgi:hypothetical protein